MEIQALRRGEPIISYTPLLSIDTWQAGIWSDNVLGRGLIQPESIVKGIYVAIPLDGVRMDFHITGNTNEGNLLMDQLLDLFQECEKIAESVFRCTKKR